MFGQDILGKMHLSFDQPKKKTRKPKVFGVALPEAVVSEPEPVPRKMNAFSPVKMWERTENENVQRVGPFESPQFDRDFASPPSNVPTHYETELSNNLGLSFGSSRVSLRTPCRLSG